MSNPIYSEGPITAEKCQLSSMLKRDPTLICLFVLEDVFAVLTLLGLAGLSRSFEFRKLVALLSLSLKAVSAVGIFFYLLCSTVNIAFYSYSIILYLRQLPDCDYVWNNLMCHLVRYTTRYCSVGYTTFHVILLIERTVAAFGWCKNKMWLFSIVLIFFQLVTPLFFVLVTFWNEPSNGYQVYCYSTKSAAQVMLITKYSLAAVDVISMVGDFLLLAFNKHQLKSKTAKYNLKKSFDLFEMQISIKLIFPMTLIHTIAMIPYFLLSSISLQVDVLEQILNYVVYSEYSLLAKAFYSAIIPPSVYIIHRLTKTRRVDAEWTSTINHADEHFNQLKMQFEVLSVMNGR